MSRKKKKQSWGAFPLLGAVPTGTVTIKNPDYETREQLLARLQREEAEAKRDADPMYQAEQNLNKTMTELRMFSSEFWSRPIAEIIPELYTESAKDMTFSVPAVRDSYELTDAQRSFNEWFDTTFSRSGYELTEAGGAKLVRFGLSQAKLNGADMSQTSAWQSAFLHLKDNLKAFTEGVEIDSSHVPRVRQVETPVRPNLDELLNTVSGESTEGRKKLIEAVTDDVLTGEYAAYWSAFLESIATNFKYWLTEAEKKTFFDTMVRRNKSFNRPKDYDEIRVALVQSGNLPKHLLYPAEKLALELEDADLSDRNVRQEFARRTRELAEAS